MRVVGGFKAVLGRGWSVSGTSSSFFVAGVFFFFAIFCHTVKPASEEMPSNSINPVDHKDNILKALLSVKICVTLVLMPVSTAISCAPKDLKRHAEDGGSVDVLEGQSLEEGASSHVHLPCKELRFRD